MKEVTLDNLPKKKKGYTSQKTVLMLQKLQKEVWKIHTLNKDIQRTVTDYLNRIGEDSIEETINYKGSPVTVFGMTAEGVKFIKESPEIFPTSQYVLYHRKKGTRKAWAFWRG